MAYKNKKISNPKTGQDILFIQTSKDTNGELLEMESTYNSFSLEPVPHYHPYQTEDFNVLEGELSVRINGTVQVLKKGDLLHVPANTIHSMWNSSTNMARVNWQTRPAMDTEYLLETGMGLAIDGKVNAKGMPSILQVVLMANKFANVYRLSKPAFVIQKILFVVITPFAYLAGYKPTYKKYLD